MNDRARGGVGEERFRALVEPAFPDLWRYARRRSRSSADADDVAAEVLAVAWRRRAALPDGDGARLWLLGIARKVLANQRRGHARRLALHARAAAHAPTWAPPADPADAVTDALAPDRPLLAALAALREDDRDLLLLRAWDGLAVTEIATLLGTTPNAVSIRLTRARHRLAAELDARTTRTRSPQTAARPDTSRLSTDPEGGTP